MSDAAPITSEVDLGRERGQVVRQLLRNPLGLVGGGLLVLVVLTAVFAPLIAPYSPTEVHFDTPFQRPFTVGFPLGTDDLGRDVLCDAVVSRLTDLTLAFPFLIIAVGLAAINGASLTNAAIALGIAQIPTMVRVVRAETLRHKELEFVLAARTLDASDGRIMFSHILPNAASAVIVQATVIMPVAVIGEALLSFLGLGIQPPTPSLGIMLSDAQQYIFRAPWAAVFPGLAIALICLSFNLFGDALRDALDPSTQR
jgi:peptide/nickel transport system permease protein